MDDSAIPDAGWTLHFGSFASKGITWNAQVTAPAGGYGEIAFTQLICVDRERVLTTGATQKIAANDAGYILDDAPGIQYDGAVTIGDSDTQSISRNDTPWVNFEPRVNGSQRP